MLIIFVQVTYQHSPGEARRSCGTTSPRDHTEPSAIPPAENFAHVPTTL